MADASGKQGVVCDVGCNHNIPSRGVTCGWPLLYQRHVACLLCCSLICCRPVCSLFAAGGNRPATFCLDRPDRKDKAMVGCGVGTPVGFINLRNKPDGKYPHQ